jgi:signal transduction histidine kinase
MSAIMKIYNTTYKSQEKLKEFIIQNHLDKNHKGVFVQIFTGIVDKEFITLLVNSIVNIIPNVKIIGSTTDGEIIEEDIKEYSTVLSFCLLEKSSVKTHLNSCDTSSKLSAKQLYEQFENPEKIKLMISFCDGLHINGEEFIKAFGECNDDIVIAGGLAADNAKFSKTFVFSENGCYKNGCVAAVFYGDELIVNSTKSFGWRRIGKNLKVTKSKENIVYTIDGINAVDLYKKYLGQSISDELPATGIEFPLIIYRNNMEIARAVIDIDRDSGALVFAGNINEGDTVQFGYGDVDTIKSLISTTRDNILSQPVEAMYIYSCMARKRLMGNNVLTEIFPLSKLAPTCGFFTYGEFFTQEKKHELLNQTMTILTLSEDKNHYLKDTQIDDIQIIESNKTVNALTHLVGVATDEWLELNRTLEEKILDEVEKNRSKDKQLLKQSRFAQMGEMISVIAHQWRQPLAAIGSAATALKIKAKLDKADKDLISDICDKILFSTHHLSTTIDDFRDFYKSNKETKDSTFGEIIDGVLNIVKLSIENKNIKIILDLQYNEKITTYPNEMKQVVMNLVKNAEDALLESDTQSPYIKISTYEKNDKSILEVSDNAGGIPEDIIESVFDLYFSTKKTKDGTGLGLYISKTIIEEHCQGKLSVYNNNDGAVFRIELG